MEGRRDSAAVSAAGSDVASSGVLASSDAPVAESVLKSPQYDMEKDQEGRG